MAELGIMIEAQEGLTWEHWRPLVAAVERLGFASLRTSDHCQSVMGADRLSLSAWPALALAAEWTERIQLAPMVSPLTFYVPAVLARTARAVDELASGRVLLGVGAGWNESEHETFGIPFPGWRERFDNLERGIERIRSTLGDYPLPLLVGGRSPRSLRIAAREAAEWNLTSLDPELVTERSAELDRRCREAGRDPAAVRRSIMAGYLIGGDRAELRARAHRLSKVLPPLAGMEPDAVIDAYQERNFVGTPGQVVERMHGVAAAGVGLIMLQHFLLDDIEHLELLASEVMPALAGT